MEQQPKQEHYEILREWMGDDHCRHRLVRLMATPNGEIKPRMIEIEYREIHSGAWKKIYDPSRDLRA